MSTGEFKSNTAFAEDKTAASEDLLKKLIGLTFQQQVIATTAASDKPEKSLRGFVDLFKKDPDAWIDSNFSEFLTETRKLGLENIDRGFIRQHVGVEVDKMESLLDKAAKSGTDLKSFILKGNNNALESFGVKDGKVDEYLAAAQGAMSERKKQHDEDYKRAFKSGLAGAVPGAAPSAKEALEIGQGDPSIILKKLFAALQPFLKELKGLKVSQTRELKEMQSNIMSNITSGFFGGFKVTARNDFRQSKPAGIGVPPMNNDPDPGEGEFAYLSGPKPS